METKIVKVQTNTPIYKGDHYAVFPSSGADLSRVKQGQVKLFDSHKVNDSMFMVGDVLDAWIDETNVYCEISMNPESPNEREKVLYDWVYNRGHKGFSTGIGQGWNSTKIGMMNGLPIISYNRWNLVELSILGIPGDPNTAVISNSVEYEPYVLQLTDEGTIRNSISTLYTHPEGDNTMTPEEIRALVEQVLKEMAVAQAQQSEEEKFKADFQTLQNTVAELVVALKENKDTPPVADPVKEEEETVAEIVNAILTLADESKKNDSLDANLIDNAALEAIKNQSIEEFRNKLPTLKVQVSSSDIPPADKEDDETPYNMLGVMDYLRTPNRTTEAAITNELQISDELSKASAEEGHIYRFKNDKTVMIPLDEIKKFNGNGTFDGRAFTNAVNAQVITQATARAIRLNVRMEFDDPLNIWDMMPSVGNPPGLATIDYWTPGAAAKVSEPDDRDGYGPGADPAHDGDDITPFIMHASLDYTKLAGTKINPGSISYLAGQMGGIVLSAVNKDILTTLHADTSIATAGSARANIAAVTQADVEALLDGLTVTELNEVMVFMSLQMYRHIKRFSLVTGVSPLASDGMLEDLARIVKTGALGGDGVNAVCGPISRLYKMPYDNAVAATPDSRSGMNWTDFEMIYGFSINDAHKKLFRRLLKSGG